jgi:hypothetical protein
MCVELQTHSRFIPTWRESEELFIGRTYSHKVLNFALQYKGQTATNIFTNMIKKKNILTYERWRKKWDSYPERIFPILNF